MQRKVNKDTNDTIENFGSGFITGPLPRGPYIDSCRNCEYSVSQTQ
jgi:hypothetical protein